MKLGVIELGKRPAVVGTVTGEVDFSADAINRIDAFEMRVDMFRSHELADIVRVINSVKTAYGKPLIATVRSKIEGGAVQIGDDKRYEIFREVAPLVEAVDVELSSGDLLKRVFPLYKGENRLAIASYHNFNHTPPEGELGKIVLSGKNSGADIVKIAVKANCKQDLVDLVLFTAKHKDQNLITISLGEIGAISRIFNPIIGSLLTYGYINTPTAPGQLPALDIIENLRVFDSAYNYQD